MVARPQNCGLALALLCETVRAQQSETQPRRPVAFACHLKSGLLDDTDGRFVIRLDDIPEPPFWRRWAAENDPESDGGKALAAVIRVGPCISDLKVDLAHERKTEIGRSDDGSVNDAALVADQENPKVAI